MRRAQLQETEKDEVLAQFKAQEHALGTARAEIEALRRRLANQPDREPPIGRMRHYIRSIVIPKIGKDVFEVGGPGVIREKFDDVQDTLDGAFLADMRSNGLLSVFGRLTPEGVMFLRRAARAPEEDGDG